ncbi:hypothetical protein GCM10022290_03390 [Sagittula marina]
MDAAPFYWGQIGKKLRGGKAPKACGVCACAWYAVQRVGRGYAEAAQSDALAAGENRAQSRGMTGHEPEVSTAEVGLQLA